MYFWMNVIMRWKQLISRIFSCFKSLKSFYKLPYSEMCIQFIISYDNEKGNEMMEDPTWITLPYWITEPINLEVSDSFCRRSTSAACWNNEFFKLIAIYISKVINDTILRSDKNNLDLMYVILRLILCDNCFNHLSFNSL